MIKELKQELNKKGYSINFKGSWIQVKQDKEVGDVNIIFVKKEKWIKVNSFADLEVLEIAIKLFKEISK